jgi:5-methylcytosine-specific restriction endonuclease McrA
MVVQVLRRPALVLNRSWQPVNVASVARALVLVWNGQARIVDPHSFQLMEWHDWTRLTPEEGAPFIQAVKQRICMPEVIALNRYDRMPTSAVTFSRRNIFKRDRYTCQYCGSQPNNDALTVDHVVPRAQGGNSHWENCVLACLSCNGRKADRTPEQAKMRLRKAPVRPLWKPLYTDHVGRIASWSKFISEAYWTAELKE